MTIKIKPSELNREARRLIDAGQMPSLETLLQAISDTRRKYAPLIVAGREERNNDGENASGNDPPADRLTTALDTLIFLSGCGKETYSRHSSTKEL